jgi:type II secretory pathway pseudopilin PulG
MEPLIIVGVIAAIVVLAVLSYLSAQKRRQAMMALAARLGLRFDPQKDWGLAKQYSFLNKLRTGSNRYAFNTLSGNYQKCDVTVFDHHYETYSSDSKGNRQTHHHYFSCFLLHLPRSFPELVIGREGFFSKIAQAFGYDDIDFESHEFSRKFCVRSPNKKFAYDVCNARMMEYLLANDDLTIEIDQNVLSLTFDSRLDPARIEPNLNRLVTLRALIPDYLFEGLQRE